MRCLPIPNGVVCYAFCGYGGPRVVTRRGDVAKRQPGERSPFWPAFEEWHRARVSRTEGGR